MCASGLSYAPPCSSLAVPRSSCAQHRPAPPRLHRVPTMRMRMSKPQRSTLLPTHVPHPLEPTNPYGYTTACISTGLAPIAHTRHNNANQLPMLQEPLEFSQSRARSTDASMSLRQSARIFKYVSRFFYTNPQPPVQAAGTPFRHLMRARATENRSSWPCSLPTQSASGPASLSSHPRCNCGRSVAALPAHSYALLCVRHALTIHTSRHHTRACREEYNTDHTKNHWNELVTVYFSIFSASFNVIR